MKVFLYTVKIHESPADKNSFEQIRIFIPDKGIFAFHKEKSANEEKIIVDFFTDKKEDLDRDKKFLDEITHLEQNEPNPNLQKKFAVAITLPDSLVEQTIAIAKKSDVSKQKFETFAKALFTEAEIGHITINNNNNQERN